MPQIWEPVLGRFRLPAEVIWASVVCRSQPPAIHFSVSPLEITDAQMPLARGRVVPTTDPRSMEVISKSLSGRAINSHKKPRTVAGPGI
jgi:hypothetical protein